METEVEFNGERARLYEIAIASFPEARRADIDTMHNLLSPQRGERILGFGEGNGYFCKAIAEAIGTEGHYLVTDPSKDQLENLVKRVNLPQMEVQTIRVEGIEVEEDSFDKVWCFGAFHHVPNQTEAMKRIYSSLKPNGKLVLCDVFQGSKLAKHFDAYVARYCVTGHEVKFLSEDFTKSLCYLAGFDERNVSIRDLPQKWIFNSEHDLGKFVNDIHAITLLPGTDEERIEQTVKSCRDVLGIDFSDGKYKLNWPIKALTAVK